MNAKMRAARTANPNGGDVSTANGETDASTATNSDNGAMDNTANDNGGHTGAMVALVPQDSDLKRLAVPGGEDITQLHLTLMFLGEGSAYDMPMRDRVVNAMRQLSVDLPPIEGNGFAINMFNPNGGPDGQQPCVVLGVAGPELKYVHDRVEDIIQTEVDNQLVPEQHQPWIPHVTLMYSPDQELVGQLSDRTGDITFDTLRIAFADNVTDIPLGLSHDDMNEQLRSAMQPRIKANPLSPEVEYKGVRHVRTAAGERKYGQPIGSVIIDDGAGHTTPLAHLTSLPAQFEGWSRYQGSNGQNYEVGYDDEKKRFMASKEGSWRALHTGSSAEEVLQKLNASIAPKEKPAPKSTEAAAKRIAKSPTTSKPNAAQRAADTAQQRQTRQYAPDLSKIHDRVEGGLAAGASLGEVVGRFQRERASARRFSNADAKGAFTRGEITGNGSRAKVNAAAAKREGEAMAKQRGARSSDGPIQSLHVAAHNGRFDNAADRIQPMSNHELAVGHAYVSKKIADHEAGNARYNKKYTLGIYALRNMIESVQKARARENTRNGRGSGKA